jgi:hypothetical protein
MYMVSFLCSTFAQHSIRTLRNSVGGLYDSISNMEVLHAGSAAASIVCGDLRCLE